MTNSFPLPTEELARVIKTESTTSILNIVLVEKVIEFIHLGLVENVQIRPFQHGVESIRFLLHLRKWKGLMNRLILGTDLVRCVDPRR